MHVGSQPHPNPRAIHRRITGGELKKAAEKLKKSVLQKGAFVNIIFLSDHDNKN